MILSRYSNPPYRSPMSSKSMSASPPPPHLPPPPPSSQNSLTHSPKRKRSNSDSEHGAGVIPATPSLLRIDTDPGPVIESGANSPRTKVAERLRGLELSTPKKKLRRNVTSGGRTGRDSDVMEIAETPQISIESDAGPSAFMDEVRDPAIPTIEPRYSPSARRLSTPPLPGPSSQPTPPHPASMSANSSFNSESTISLSFSDSEDQDPTDLTSLTWQDSEITGQDIDKTDPGDDGEGINGIGFKPTPAMAHARSLKRRQQVNEWKAREAREARQKRIEKRRAGSGAGNAASEDAAAAAKRSVRFVGFS